jgi:non-canonical purine NTP pyrophosphatase (RdgB/HAM1 family)
MKHSFDELVKIMQKLRKECPWDKEQTIESFRRDIQGEIKELSEAVDKKDYKNLREEVGDVMLSLIALSVVAKEKGYFDIHDSLKEATEKMIRRHPHVFGKEKAKNAAEALKLFYKAKAKEKMKTIYFVTGNSGKFREARNVLKKYDVKLKQIKYSKPEDKKLSIEKIAENAARILIKKFKKPLIAEDTGIFFEAYKDFPGRNSKVIFNKLGLNGILKKLENKNRRAYFKTAIGYANEKKTRIFVGYCRGEISEKVIGK